MLLLILLTSLSLNLFAAENAKVLLTTSNSVLIASDISQGSTTMAMLELAALVIKRAGSNYPLYIVLDSPGGSIDSGDTFIQFAKTISNLHTVTIYAASMASAIVESLPGNRYVTEHGLFMFHRARVTVSGQVSEGELESRLRSIKRTVQRMEINNAKRIGMSLEDYKEKVKDEWWLDAEEAIEQKVADLIVDIHCSPALIDKKIKVKKQSFLGPYDAIRSACPLIP